MKDKTVAPPTRCSELFRHPTYVVDALKKIYPDAVCALEFEDEAWKLLVMSILSAQCTDKRVNLVSKPLFARFPTPRDIAECDLIELEEYIKSCGLYRTKAKNIRAAMAMLCDVYGGEVPSDMDALLELPGVGRKIANLIRGDVYGLPAIVADTHCIRLSGRLGFTPGISDALKVEKTLKSVIAEEEQNDFCHRLVMYGREYCTAKSPLCADCPLCRMVELRIADENASEL